MWITRSDRAPRAGISPGRRRLLGGGLSLLALTWLSGPSTAVIGDRQSVSPMAIGDGFVVIDGWVLPASYFRE